MSDEFNDNVQLSRIERSFRHQRQLMPGVFFDQDLFLLFAVDLGVDMVGGDRAMAEQGLDVLDVDVVL